MTVDEARTGSSASGRSADAPEVSAFEPRWLPRLDPIGAAIVRAVAYADVFNAPLPRSRIFRSIDCPATAAEIDALLDEPAWAAGLLDIGADDVTLAGRHELRSTRADRRQISRRRWVSARRAGRLLGALPFIRFVAVSGSLAVDEADADADIDLFLVTADGRLWLARRLVVGVVRLAALVKVPLCPNYLVAESAIELDDRTIFVAHELAQLVRVGGAASQSALIARNAWAARLLPNAFRGAQGGAGIAEVQTPTGRVRQLVERLLRASILDRVERWEMARMRRRHPPTSGEAQESRFDRDRCKGHLVPNGRRALDAYSRRLAALDGSANARPRGPVVLPALRSEAFQRDAALSSAGLAVCGGRPARARP